MAVILWTDDEVAQLRNLWRKQSAKKIAAILGTTRNSVIGKARRVGLSAVSTKKKREKNNGETGKPKTKKKSVKKFIHNTTTPIVRHYQRTDLWKWDPVTERTTTLLALKKNQCRWPVGEEGHPHNCCGAEVIEGKPYCIDHCRRAYSRKIVLAESYVVKSLDYTSLTTEEEE